MPILAATLALTGISSASATPWPSPPRHRATCGSRPAPSLCRLHWWVRRTWGLQDARYLQRTRYWWTAEHHPHAAPWLARRMAWRARAASVAAIPRPPWPRAWLSDALCVHHYEGAWTDPNAPYWGGMQMDRTFMATYGRRFYLHMGTADQWPPRDQLLASYRAWRVRGWTPWPNTAAACGLL